MELKRTSHAVYDMKYHLVWVPKYRKWILRGEIRTKVEEIFREVAEDHVHVFLSFPPRYGISRVVGMLKSISAGVIFREYPEVKRELWGGEFW